MWLRFSPPCFPSCWPHHHVFWLPELLHGGHKGNTCGKCVAASWSSCLCFLIVHHDVPHVGHQPIGSARSLCADHRLRAPGLFFFSTTRWISRSPERGIPFKRAACCQGVTKYKGSDVLSVGDRRQEDNCSAVIFDSTGQYATESIFLVLKKMIFPCLSLLCIYPCVR